MQCEWGDCHSGLAIVSEILSPYCSDGSLCLAGNFLKASNAFQLKFLLKTSVTVSEVSQKICQLLKFIKLESSLVRIKVKLSHN